ncbi:electron transfer flavoprotein subunit alpha/FixB family protein [Alteromonas lipolytica]|uniref:Electron transfer flavoprotein subunit alpha n=1 Tax=Alteromonas lipolytica TaxID=1856405 RepID=A0A1E8FBV8_9ALTE|nr:FAD-binding protein [Alteromonas lipolytica]OFI33389.1 electron transfer flavoprotein subunit beta [Alteromonas lipolytica]GGF60132.1 electron transfer flavoprotein subunit alpha [Alteromonas lipolytica]
MSVLVIAEHDNKSLKGATLNTITAATQLSEQVDVLVAGTQCADVAAAVAKVAGVSNVLVFDSPAYEHQLAESLAPLLKEIASDYKYVLAPATTFGKNLLPRAAALLDCQPISDIIEVVDGTTFKRPIYAGNAIATVTSQQSKLLLTVRSTAFDPAPSQDSSAPIQNQDIAITNELSHFVGEQVAESDRPELTAANIVISGGRGMQNGDNFSLLYGIADKLGAAVGASRAAVDSGFVPNDMQVGQTGKIVAPDLYIAVGISGAIQHLAGMKDSKVIVAINKDEDAPIFQVADYGLVADLFTALPELNELL